MEWNKFEDKEPPAEKEVLVYQPWGHSGFSVKRYVPNDGIHCWGWYPGGGQTGDTYWAELPSPPV